MPAQRQQSQQATEVVILGALGLRLYDRPGDGKGVLAIDHSNDQRQHQRLLVQLPRGGRPPPAAHPLQKRGEAECHLQFLTRTPGIYAVRIVIQQLPQQAPQLVRIAGALGAMRQGQGHRILTAVQGQQRDFHPQGQHRLQVAGQFRQLRFQ